MRVARNARYVCLFIVCLMIPFSGLCDFPGGIMVFAWDSSDPTAAPPTTIATLNGNENQSFEGSDLVTFSGYFEAGTHVVEVATQAEGYILRQCPTDPNALNDPYSDYGNPRYVEISESTNYVPVSFQFDPVITASAIVRDAWTMERLDDAQIIFTGRTGANSGLIYTDYPWEANYASNWITDAEGRFPTNTILYFDDYDLTIIKNGYHTYSETNTIIGTNPGDTIDLGTIFMEAIDNNSNQIADAWETAYFGSGYTVVTNEDEDGDGISNRDEYIAGTNPTNQQSCLWVECFPATNGYGLTWDVAPDRTYRVCGTTNLCTNSWVQVAGPWEASPEQFEMVWVETNTDLSWNSNYRIEVVPSWWADTNQVLINTNRPAAPSGSGTYTNWPGIPPIPGE